MQVILLSSLDAMAKRDQQIAQRQVSYITEDTAWHQRCQDLAWNQLQVSRHSRSGCNVCRMLWLLHLRVNHTPPAFNSRYMQFAVADLFAAKHISASLAIIVLLVARCPVNLHGQVILICV